MNDEYQGMKSKTRHPFLRLLKYGKPHIGWFLLALAIILGTVWLELMQPRILGNAIDNFVVAKQADGVIRMGRLYLATVLGGFALTYCQAMILAYVGQKIIFTLREDLFTHLTTLDISFFNDNPVGRLVTRVTNDCETVNELFTEVIVNVLKGIFVLI
ncbi:MAG: ABC transporter ATP-binding protein, partial [Firmicutes bacterium]|nr:ABC transporter ATP-binding protein [Bacillota bacterium]